MKKILSLMLAVLLLTLALGCSSGDDNDPNLGVYTAKTAEYGGFTLDVGQFFEKGFTIELKSGGKATLVFGDEEPDDATWKVDGEKLIFSAEGETLEASIKNGTITLEEDGSVMEFVKAK